MMGILLIALGAVFFIILIMFLNTISTLEQKTVESLGYVSKSIGSDIDDVILNIQNVSDAFANEPRLHEYIDCSFEAGDELGRISTVQSIRNNIFAGFNRLRDINQISAIYNVRTGELFNFVDMHNFGSSAKAVIDELDMNAPEKLSMYYWYPLRDDFLRGEASGNIRQDSVVTGSRRIYDGRRVVAYPYIHIFEIQEQTLYSIYKEQAKQSGGEVYILDGTGELISSSDLKALEERKAPPGLAEAVLARNSSSFKWENSGVKSFVSTSQSRVKVASNEQGGWITVLLVPVSVATGEITKLYLMVFAVLFFCILLCVFMLVYLYRRFMDPISALGSAMLRVDSGDMEAYVEGKQRRGEAGAMIDMYNQMLKSINRNIEEKLALEKAKKELDMQVLTTQINPHFLYNTLETIVWKASEAGRPDIGKIASSLGKMYRLSVNNGKAWIRFEYEIEHLRSYVEIQKNRYGNRFTFECSADEAALPLLVPKLILQPIVENIFLYAMDDEDRHVHIRVKIRLKDGCLKIKVLDNGPGMDKKRLDEVRRQIQTGISPDNGSRKKGTGIGLHNIQARLELYMGAQNALHIQSRENHGTKVTITINTKQ